MANKKQNDEILSSKQAAEMLGMSVATLQRRVAAGRIVAIPKPPTLERHHRLQFLRSEIEKHLQQ